VAYALGSFCADLGEAHIVRQRFSDDQPGNLEDKRHKGESKARPGKVPLALPCHTPSRWVSFTSASGSRQSGSRLDRVDMVADGGPLSNDRTGGSGFAEPITIFAPLW
jgi:hypothetical protein